MMAHSCNPNSLGGRGKNIQTLKPPWTNPALKLRKWVKTELSGVILAQHVPCSEFNF